MPQLHIFHRQWHVVQIGNNHIFHCCHITFRGCMSEVVVLSYPAICYVFILGTLGLGFHLWCVVYGNCKWLGTLWPVGLVHLFAHYPSNYRHLTDLSEGIQLLKYFSGICCRVLTKIKSVLSIVLHPIHPSVFSSYLNSCDCENVHFIQL